MALQFALSEIRPGLSCLAMTGSIHCGPECSQLEAEVDRLMQQNHTQLIFDLSHVTTMDSAAIGSVVRCLRKLKNAGGDLRLAAAPPLIARNLEQTKVNKIVPTFASVSDAAASFAATV